MRKGLSSYGYCSINLDEEESAALERLLNREQQKNVHAQAMEAELAIGNKRMVERICELELQIAKLEAKEIDGRTERRVRRRRDMHWGRRESTERRKA